jgi:hydrogenase-4 component F
VIVLVVGLPVLASLLALITPPWLARHANTALLVATSLVAAALTQRILSTGVPVTALDGWLRADGLACIVSLTVAMAASVGAACGAHGYAGAPRRAARVFTILFPLLTAALLLGALSDHLGILWIALELAAVLSAFLIGAGGKRTEHEAALKYMLLGSAGLVMSLLATVIVYHAGAALGHGDAALSFSRLRGAGLELSAQPMRIALALAAAGYGLKVGLFPLHVWKPDAYSAAPGPITALLAGGGVLVPLEALLRFGELTTAAGEGAFTSQLFQVAGVVSMLAALLLMTRERDMRRILAFTSVEHMGLILLAVGAGTTTARGGLLHLAANGILKALAFGVLGMVVVERGTGDTQSGPGLYRHSLALSAVFLTIVAAGLGFPPFAMFTSELTILTGLFAGGHVLVAILVLVALAAVFGVVISAALRLVFARADEASVPAVRHGGAATAIALPALLVAALLGLALPTSTWQALSLIAGSLSP